MTRTDRTNGRPAYVPKAVADRPDAWRERLAERTEKFDAINRFVTSRHGHVTSVPGDSLVTIEVQEDSDLPQELEALGYRLHEVDRRERLDPFGKIEEIRDGLRVLHRRHAGLVPVIVYTFVL